MPPLSGDAGRNGLSSMTQNASTDPRRTGANPDAQRAQSHAPLPPGATSRRPAGPSPQQIMRARYKEQMMPPRTWRQQEERRKQIDEESRQRLANSSSTMRAAAATAAGASKASAGPPQTAPTSTTASAPTTTSKPATAPAAQRLRRASTVQQTELSARPGAPASSATQQQPPRSRSGSVQAAQSVTRAALKAQSSTVRAAADPLQRPRQPASRQPARPGSLHSSPQAHRPPMERRSSSQNSLSLLAATSAIQPRRRNSVDSWNSGSSAASRTVRADDANGDITVSPSTLRSAGPSPNKAAAGGSTVSSPSSAANAVVANSRSARQPSKFGGVPTVREAPKRSVTASAAARASAASPIEISPREPLSSKFVSSLSQALKREQAERQEEQKAAKRARDDKTAGLEKTFGTITTKDTFRSSPSDKTNLAVPLHAARSSSSTGSRGSQQNSGPDAAKAEMESKKKKASALSAALAAEGKAESEMARIHMQVNLAVQNALETQSRRELMKKYRPASHWSAPVKPFRRPQLKRLNTSDSNASAVSAAVGPENRSGAVSTSPSTVKPWQVLPEVDDSGDSVASTPMTPSSSQQNFGSVPMSYTLSDSVGPASSVPSLAQSKSPASLTSPASPSAPAKGKAKSTEVPRWKSWTQSVLNKQRAKPKDTDANHVNEHTALPPSTHTAHIQSPNTPATYVVPGLAGKPPVTRQEPMFHTLRGRTMRSKRFNEEKPWKNHQDLNYLSETERKRYEKLWAANRCTHLPFVFINPEFEGFWHAAVSRRFPQLYKKESNNSDQSSTRTSDSGNSRIDFSPTRSYKDADGASSFGSPHRAVSFNSNYAWEPPGRFSGYTPGSPRSPYGAPEAIRVESAEHLIDGDREISPESVEAEDEALAPAGDKEIVPTTRRDYLDDLQSIASSIEKDVEKQSEDVHGYVVSRLWRRSRLPEETLAEIWNLVDTNRDGTLDRSSFVVGMWLCDQCLYGRKLPAKVPQEVWQSVGKLHLKVRFKQPKSKTWYVSRLPNFMGSAVGHTMHGGRQAVKKVVQTATS